MRPSKLFILLLISLLMVGISAAPMGATSLPGESTRDVLVGFHGTPVPGLVRAFGAEVYAEFTLVDVVGARMSPKAAEALARHPAVRFVESDAPAYAHETTLASSTQSVPWGIDRVFDSAANRAATWEVSRGNAVGIAVLDTGIDATHSDLTVVDGVNVLDGSDRYGDGHGHGTHVAGTIAALDNAIGVVGVGPAAALYAVKVLDDGGSGSYASIIAGIQWAVDHPGDISIVNMSLGGSSDSIALREACAAAYEAGLLLVSSAGNSGTPSGRGDNVGYPARYATVIAVAASDSNDSRPRWSSTGPDVELIAPGVSVLSTVPGDGYATKSGTSMASPHVAGAASLAWAAAPTLTNAELRAILRTTAEDIGLSAIQGGYGLVRADRAVAAVGTTEPEPQLHAVVFLLRDTDDHPLAGVRVTLDDMDTQVTDEEGSARFPEVGAGTHSYRAELEGYETASGTIDVTQDMTVPVEMILSDPEDPPPDATGVFVADVAYATSGGRHGDRHLQIRIELRNSEGGVVSGASVSMKFGRDDADPYAVATGTTGSDGGVRFDLNNFITAPPGVYKTTVTAVAAGDFAWDGNTPANSFIKE